MALSRPYGPPVRSTSDNSAFERLIMALTPHQRRFVSAYLETFNATQAAIDAGYAERSASNQGHRLMKNDEVLEAIAEALDATAMRAEESLMRLATHARANMGDFLNFAEGEGYTLALPDDPDKLALIKKLKQRRTERTDANGNVTSVETWHELELHDAQSALKTLAQVHGLLRQRVDVNNLDYTKMSDQQLERIAAGEDPVRVILSTLHHARPT